MLGLVRTASRHALSGRQALSGRPGLAAAGLCRWRGMLLSTEAASGDGEYDHTATTAGWKLVPARETPSGARLLASAPKPVSACGRDPLVVVIGWLGSPPKYLAKYLEFYHSRGLDTLSLVPGPKDVLQPDHGLNRMRELLRFFEQDEQKDRPWLVHVFSTGGYMFGQMLEVVKRESHHRATLDNIQLQVVDSPVDFQHVPTKLPRAVFPKSPLKQKISTAIVKTMLTAFKTSITDKLENSSRNFHMNSVKAPALWYFSHDDDIGPVEDCLTVIREWEENGIECHVMQWEKSRHVTHMARHPHDYTTALDRYMDKYLLGEQSAEYRDAIARLQEGVRPKGKP